MKQETLQDAMGHRPLSARWRIMGLLTLTSPMHLGGQENSATDMPILRDALEDCPLLPGTTLGGALRNALADHLAGFSADEPAEVAELFGAGRADDKGKQSPLIIFDAIGTLPSEHNVEIRDGVAISPRTGIAEDNKKYDYEVLPAGTTFPIRIDLLVPQKADETKLLSALATTLDTFSSEQHSFGAKRTRGFGRIKISWSAHRFDFTKPEGWLEWGKSEHLPALPAEDQLSSIKDALQKNADAPPFDLLQNDKRFSASFDLSLSIKQDILVRSSGTKPNDPDQVQLHSADKPVLPGTSLTGVLRVQALRIAKLVRANHNDADEWIDQLFGPRFEGQHAPDEFIPMASRIRVTEAALRNSYPKPQTRIAIDRFTQGVVDGALFDEAPEMGGSLQVTIEIRSPQKEELGLVLLVLKDLLSGRLPVGGTSSIGRGFLTGSAILRIKDGQEKREGKLTPNEPPEEAIRADVAQAIQALHNAPKAHIATQDPHTTGAVG